MMELQGERELKITFLWAHYGVINVTEVWEYDHKWKPHKKASNMLFFIRAG